MYTVTYTCTYMFVHMYCVYMYMHDYMYMYMDITVYMHVYCTSVRLHVHVVYLCFSQKVVRWHSSTRVSYSGRGGEGYPPPPPLDVRPNLFQHVTISQLQAFWVARSTLIHIYAFKNKTLFIVFTTLC